MKVLLAEDDPISRRVLETMLRKWGYEVMVTCDGHEAWDAMQEEDAPRLVILDWMMPGFDGAEVTRRIRELSSNEYVYVILLTARDRQEDIIAGMDSGADDYVIKPFDSGELRVRLHAARRILDLQAQLISAQEALRHQATHDPLTGLLNRAAITDWLERELDRAARTGCSLGLILGDLDHFKSINDTQGHAAGDAVLRRLSCVMEEAVRTYDLVGRYGGEEFLIICPGCEMVEACAVAERIRLAVQDAPIEYAGRRISVSVSLGVAACGGVSCPGGEGMILQADRAMYAAKAAGRNCVCPVAPASV